MEQNIRRQINMLKAYAIFLTVFTAFLALLVFRFKNNEGSFHVINAERINIVEDDGTIRMVISNQKNQHPGIVNGKMIAQRERPAGMIFFNNEGDECGGLVYDGNKMGASLTYSVDQYQNDQVMQLQYEEDRNTDRSMRSYGLKFWDRNERMTAGDLIRIDDSLKNLHDTNAYRVAYQKMRSEGLLSTERMYLGKTQGKNVGLFIRDNKGRSRIEIGLDSTNNVVFRILDSSGQARTLN